MTQRRVVARSAWLAAAAIAAAGCAPMQSKEPPPKPLAGTRWEALLELPVRGDAPYLRLGDGRVEGFAGCNRFNARYLQDSVGARAIAFAAISASKKLCDASTMAAESRFLEVLQYVSSYTITGDTMVMSGSAGTLRLRAVPEPRS